MPIVNGEWVEPLVYLRKELDGTGTIEQLNLFPAIARLGIAELTADNVIAFFGYLTWDTMNASIESRLAAFAELERLLEPRLSLEGQLALGEVSDDIF